MIRYSVAEMFSMAAELPTREDKVAFLKKNWNPSVAEIVRLALDPKVEWLLPEGSVPYVPNSAPYCEGALYGTVRKMYLYIRGGNDALTDKRRQALFVGMLETLDPRDAEMMVHVKDKRLPWPSLTADILNEVGGTNWPEAVDSRILDLDDEMMDAPVASSDK